MLKNKILLITGGTGSFGNAILNRVLDSGVKEIRVFSRDEKKQDDLRKKYVNPKLKFYVGDVRDYESVNNAIRGVDYVFHAAALKQVPSCEFHPLEATKTNVLGAENVLESSIQNRVKKVICLSTDKAVYPINAMGISKALMEKLAVAKSRNALDTVICVTRYGNVMASRGSVIPLFIEQISNNKAITVTNPDMTRFMMTLDEAVNLVLFAFKNGAPGDIFVQKSPAATVSVLARAVTELLERDDHPIVTIGTRHGEKLYETLLSIEEMARAIDLNEYFRIPPDMRDLNYSKYVEEGDVNIEKFTEYSSNNADRLDVDAMKKLLLNLPFISAAIRGKQMGPES
jgi:UDP-N-acetylglucosamine 4,6-dehydratase